MFSTTSSSSSMPNLKTTKMQELTMHSPLRYIWNLCLQRKVHEDVCSQDYTGNGTKDDPYIIDYLTNDPEDAMQFSYGRKWTMAILQAMSTFAVTFASSIYVSGIPTVQEQFHVSNEVATLGLSLFVLGFALGPLLWAPLSELYGRQVVYVASFTAYVVLSVGAACAQSIAALLILRFLASAFGASVMTNSAGVIADLFSPKERGIATVLFAAAPFLGPSLGPVVGGYLGEACGWRWILGLTAILAGVIGITTALATRETYAPSILRSRARALSRQTGKTYLSRIDADKQSQTLSHEISVFLIRPWVLLFCEPIVFFTSLYISIIYATLYLLFAGVPIVFEGTRGWSQGNAGLPFVGITIGVCIAILAAGVSNYGYVRECKRLETEGRIIEPEFRLKPAMTGAVILPIGLFMFAWTTYPSVHWIVPIIGATIFSTGLVMVFVSLLGYLVDAYFVYAASAMAANSVMRSLFATAFPLFTVALYHRLGDQWASSIPAFLTLACLPFPAIFYKYGKSIRSKCKYAAEAAEIAKKMHQRQGEKQPA